MSKRKWTVAIRENEREKPRKITKILALNGGGFSIMAPYHKAREGFLFKLPVDPNTHSQGHVPANEIFGFDATDRVKLSYHTDGFAQFSGENPGKILSGRDTATGVPKGLGLLTLPLSSPIRSGPSFGMLAWGLRDFEEVDDDDDTICFEPDDFYYRDCTPDDTTAFHVCGFVFAGRTWPPLRYKAKTAILNLAVAPVVPPYFATLDLKIIRLETENILVGLFVERIKTTFKSESGWTLNGPGDWLDGKPGHNLMAVYPRETIPVAAVGSVDYDPSP